MKFLKRSFLIGTLLGVLLGALIWYCNYKVEENAVGRMYSSTQKIPKNKVGLLLGTSKYTKSKTINIYYKYRIDAAVRLYRSGKVDYILVSGDNGSKSYDEPTTFKKDLVKRGIPESKIYLDFAGFRTFDSIVRAKEVFGQQSFTIISQPFHNKRALYIAKSKGLDAIAYNANRAKGTVAIRVKVRELLARVKLFVDIASKKKPKFLGAKIKIG